MNKKDYFEDNLKFAEFTKPFVFKTLHSSAPVLIWDIEETIPGGIEDKEYHIDYFLNTSSGQISLQTKVLRNKNAYFDTVTIEYMNNPKTGKLGELNTIQSDWYFSGYMNTEGTGLQQWIILDTQMLIAWIKSWPPGLQEYRTKHNKTESNASFIYIPYEALICEGQDFVLAHYYPFWPQNTKLNNVLQKNENTCIEQVEPTDFFDILELKTGSRRAQEEEGDEL